jgi:hypothetical protein
MTTPASIKDMMARFHNQPPTSRAEREHARANGSMPDAMWWSRNDKGPGEQHDVSIHKDSHTHINAAGDDRMDHSDGAEPRIGSTLRRPEPAVRSISPQSRIAKYECKYI